MNDKLSPRMEAAMRGATLNHDWELHVGWKGAVSSKTLAALRSRGLIDESHILTEAGEAWLSAND